MTVEANSTLAILIGLFGLLIKTKLPPAAISMGALTLVITFRLAPLEGCLRGFSNSGMLTIGALFMVTAGMYTTGAIGMVSDGIRSRRIQIHRFFLKSEFHSPLWWGSSVCC